MSSNPSIRNLSIHNIVLQNQELRKALAQSRQYEQLFQELASTIDLLKIKQVELLNANTALMEKLTAQKTLMDQRQNAYSEQMQYVFTQHDKIILSKEQQLKNCKNQLERLIQRYKQVEEYARVYQERERQISQNYEAELTKYKSKIVDFQAQLQSVYRSSQMQKLSFEKARSNFIVEQQSQSKQIVNLANIVKKLESDNLMMIDYSKQIEANLINSEEENKTTLITLREKLIQQEGKIFNYIFINKGLENSNQIIAKELEDLKRLQAHLNSDSQNLAMENDKIINLLAESDKESKYLRGQITELQLNLSLTLEKNEMQLQQMRNEKLELLRSKTEAETYANAKVAQLREITASANKLQALATKQEGHINNLNADLNDIELLLSKQKQKSSQLAIRVKQLTDINQAIKQQNERFQEIKNKLQAQIEQLTNQTLILAKNSLNPKDINKQFIQQMNNMLIKFREQRQEQNKYHVLEKEKMKERYEYEIKQIELDLLKKISLLEEQLALSKKFEILTQRNNNIYTYTSKI